MGKLISVKEAADRKGVAITTIYHWIAANRVQKHHIEVGNRMMVAVDEDAIAPLERLPSGRPDQFKNQKAAVDSAT